MSASTLPPTLHAPLATAHAQLRALYGARLVRVVVYGSQARGDATPASDVDVLVGLRDAFDLHMEIKHLTPIALDLLEQYGASFSFQPFTERQYRERRSPFLINVRREGVEL